MDKIFRLIIWRLLFLLICILIAVPLFAEANDLALPPSEFTHPDTVTLTLARVDRADELCRAADPHFVTQEWDRVVLSHTRGKRTEAKPRSDVKILERPIVLCAYNERDDTWHVIEVHVTYPLPECFKHVKTEEREATCGTFPARIITKGNYRIAYQSGLGIPRLTFKVWSADMPLVVYRYRHEWLSEELLRSNVALAIEKAEPVLVTPFTSELYDPQLAMYGLKFLRDQVTVAEKELRSLRIHSQSVISDALLPDVIGWKLAALIGVIEQMDHDRFVNDPLLTTESVLIEYALNRDYAFAWSISGASAVGAFQFTDRGGNGTYSLVVNRCKANLVADFWSGARDLRNAAKAAMCLLDLELANAPLEIQELYRTNPKAAGLYPVAAYNAGGGFARRMYENFLQEKIDFAQISAEDLDLPQSAFMVMKRTQGKRGHLQLHEILNEETYMYLRKYFFVWSYLSAIPD